MAGAAGLERLSSIVSDVDAALICFSGGVDSTLLLKVAVDTLGDRAVAFTARSASLAQSELHQAKALAADLGANIIVQDSAELSDPRYANNPRNRCYFCKTHLLQSARRVAKERGIDHIFLGTNLDDLGQHRPGLKAAEEHEIRHPLVEAGLSKADVRQISRELGLQTWDKPELACLASRIPYGTQVTAERLERIERFESGLAALGFTGLRVRFHDTVARIELAPDQLCRAAEDGIREQIVDLGRSLGFTYVTLDLAGYRRGSMNES